MTGNSRDQKRLQSISSTVMSRNYNYDKVGNVKQISGNNLSATTVNYDHLHRLTSYGSVSTYQYDQVGNINVNPEPGGTTAAYVYGNARRQAVKTAHSKNYRYDLCGNMIVRGAQALEYDADNRLFRLSQPGALVVEYGYAADGERLWKRKNHTDLQVWIGKLYEEKGGKTLFHVFAGDQRICTFEPNSSLAVSGGGGASTHVGYYYHQDHLGSSSALSGRDGETLEGNVWYPFGRSQTASPQAAFQVSGRFTGQIFDSETGLYYYGARYYDPELGRFIQPDTLIPDLSNPQSYNRYAYTLNNPLKYTDPDGHAVESVWDAANLAMGVGSLIGNIKQGNIVASIVDSVGIVADGLATAVPFVPGGAGTAIRVSRAAQKVERVVNRADAAKNTVEAAASGDAKAAVQNAAGLGLNKVAGSVGSKKSGVSAKPIDDTRPQHGTVPHDATAYNKAKEWETAPNTVQSRFNQQLVDDKGVPVSGMKPDAQRTRTDGKIDVVEVISPSQTPKQMDAKIDKYKQVLGPKAGDVDWIDPVDPARR